MSWVRIWIHLVFTTKNREPLLIDKSIRKKIFEHIKLNAVEKEIYIDSVNGYTDHCHVLFSLNKEQTISKVAQLIKGESSFWINKQGLLQEQFSWQDDYWAVSISESHVKKVREYIWNQERHHKKQIFSEEMDIFTKKYGWEFIEN